MAETLKEKAARIGRPGYVEMAEDALTATLLVGVRAGIAAAARTADGMRDSFGRTIAQHIRALDATQIAERTQLPATSSD